MNHLLRRSPVSFRNRPAKTEKRDAWDVILAFENEGKGPFLIDLSHKTKWDIQDGNLSRIKPLDLGIPESPGTCTYANGILINRLNATQAHILHLEDAQPSLPENPAYTDITDGVVLLALLGDSVLSIMEKVSNLDLCDPSKKPPLMLQGPVLHVPCQVIHPGGNEKELCVLIACARGYGQSMAEALLDAGREFGLNPGGEAVFSRLLDGIFKSA